jgi:aminopeptidase N
MYSPRNFLGYSMVSSEQRWNEGNRALNRASHNMARTPANRNRIWPNYTTATRMTTTAYKQLLRKYHLPPLPPRIQTTVMRNIVRNKKAQIRHDTRVRILSKILPVNIAHKVARLLD